jgi:hypothetical protein
MVAYGNERPGRITQDSRTGQYCSASTPQLHHSMTVRVPRTIVRARQREDPFPTSPLTQRPARSETWALADHPFAHKHAQLLRGWHAGRPRGVASRTPRVILYCWMRKPLRREWVRGNCSIGCPAGAKSGWRGRYRTGLRRWRSYLDSYVHTVLDMTLTVSTSRMDLSGTWLQYEVQG